MKFRIGLIPFVLLFAFPYAFAQAEEYDLIKELRVIIGERATELERNYVNLFVDRLREQSAVQTEISSEIDEHPVKERIHTIYIGVPERNVNLRQLCKVKGIVIPDEMDPGAEGFVLRSWRGTKGIEAIAAAADEHGVAYAVGELLRRITYHETGIEFPSDLNIRTAPAFRLRGTEIQQGSTMRDITGAREWTQEERERVALDFVLAGANTVAYGDNEFVDRYGLKNLIGVSPSMGSGPPEWKAIEPIGRTTHLCPSHPEARKHILENIRNQAKNWTKCDYVRFYSADGGGCWCEKCAPYGNTYIHMCEEMANIILEYHPEAKIMATNQELDNGGDQAIFDYLNEKPRDWLWAICYSPGSNAMVWTSARRPEHRMDLFRYPGFGPIDRYLREILHQLPPQQTIVFFTDVTHWVRSQYGLVHNHVLPDRQGNLPPHWTFSEYHRHPDPALFKLYNRRTCFARPHHYYWVFHNIMHYGEGDVVYSEGHHDHFNRWMWMRMLWDPHATLDELVDEYCRFWFGPEAAPLMAKAIYQMESNLEEPLATNEGIERYFLLVREAGWKMPEWRMKKDYLWRQHMQKACLDKYGQLLLRRQMKRRDEMERLCRVALQSGELDSAIREGLSFFATDIETAEMKRLRGDAGRIGKESDESFGVRSATYFNLDIDLVGLTWHEEQLRKAQVAESDEKRERIHLIGYYENPGQGGYYDNFGEWEDDLAPHLAFGYNYSCRHSPNAFSYTNRLSQNTMVFTQNEPNGVTIEYHDLDRDAEYRIRLSLVRPEYLARFAFMQPQTTESIYADDYCLAQDMELPIHKAEFFEFDIPKKATSDGTLTIQFRKTKGVGEGPVPIVEQWKNTYGWGTLVSEAWLMKKN
ncbi:MAG: DUF4838 domain-containing protein [bacterium]